MSMKIVKTSALIRDKEGRILLQMRDEEPESGKWVPFGGSVEEGESDEQALKREILEELNYRIKELRFLSTYRFHEVDEPIFIVIEPVRLEDLTQVEGSEMRFFSPQEIESLDIGFNYKQIILDFLKSPHT
jgi:8-oxo-dGTP pyrophosphatase MutT (NUDIX family)